jgi:lipooligosaccharide transport system permease protein
MTDTLPATRPDALADAPPRPAGLLLRIAPAGMYAGRANVLVRRSFLVNRRAWLTIVSGFFEPIFYLLALGVGFGRLVTHVVGPGGVSVSYTAFVAPALLAAAAMNGAVFESTFNIFHKLKYVKLYDSMLATPLGPLDIAIGEISWALVRGGIYAVGFLIVMAAMGLLTSAWALLALPLVLLIALAFASLGMAVTTFMRSWQDFDLVNLAVLPMFFFSTTFYPLTVYPGWLRIVVQCFPLYHGVVLMRALTTGFVGWGLLWHVLYFVVMAAIGIVAAGHRLRKLLLK